MNKIEQWIIKRVILGKLNGLLEDHADGVKSTTATIGRWIERLEKVIAQLKALNDRVADGVLDEDEVKKSTEEIVTLVKEF